MKKLYGAPQLVVYGNVESLTQGPIKPSTADNPTGQGNTNIGCQPSGYNGPDYKLCS